MADGWSSSPGVVPLFCCDGAVALRWSRDAATEGISSVDALLHLACGCRFEVAGDDLGHLLVLL